MAAQQGYSMAQNMAARQMILQTAREMWQVTNTNTTATAGVQQNIPLRNIGMTKRLLLEVTATVTAGVAETLTLSRWGLANFLSQVLVTDLANYTRINTTGWHLYAIASLRRQMAYGAAFLNDAPVSMASNIAVNNAPQTVTPLQARTIRIFYELPLAYSDNDLSGAIYSAVVNATWQVSYTVNNSWVVGSAADPTFAVYQSNLANALATLTNINIRTHQIYLDQLPFTGNGQPILPYFDLGTGYLLQNTGFSAAPTVGIDYPIQYPNFRSILSATLVLDNGNPQPAAGSDINYIGIQAANLVFLLQVDANSIALRTRNTIGDDFPANTYVLETRISPINTTAYGNMQIVLNQSTVNAGWNLQLGWEMKAIINSVAGASSLPAN